MLSIHQQIASNKRNSWIIILAFIGFVTGFAYIMGEVFGTGSAYVGSALIFSLFTGVGSYFFSDKIVLGISGAKPANRDEHFDFYTLGENLSRAAGLPMPKLYVIEDSSMNAFATGRDPQHAVVVATTGILARLDRTELEGVIAHELSHVKNFDIRTMALVTVLVGVVTLMADWFIRMSWWGGRKDDREGNGQIGAIFFVVGIVLAMLSPLIANLIKLAVSRSREYLADASAVAITKYPDGLARALEKLASDHEPLEAANKATAHLYIVNPLNNLVKMNAVGMFAGLFSTHPPIEERIKRLRAMR